jgi:Tfp pilus assembly protein PilF
MTLIALGSELVCWAQGSQRDPNTMMTPVYNASISGRVVLPSGRSFSGNVKIIISNEQAPLEVRYTDKHGEFRFMNLREGIYHIEVDGDPNLYVPVTQEVRVARGANENVTIYLQEKGLSFTTSGPGVVSTVDLNQKPPVQARREYERALKLIAKGDQKKAIEHLTQAIAIYPEYLAARNDLGALYLKLKQFDQAAEQFLVNLKRDPRSFDSRLNLGLVLVELKKYPDAIDQFNEAISIDSARPAAHLWLGIALLQNNELRGAERELMKTLSMGDPQFSVAHYYLAHVRLRKGERTEAMYELRAYLEEAPTGEQSTDARHLLEKLKSNN